MAKKQVAELRRLVLGKFPDGCVLRHHRSGGYNSQSTTAVVFSKGGAVLAEQTAPSLEQALRAMAERR